MAGKTEILPGQVRVRMAPSPTGFLHIGTARTALSNFLFARRQGGMFMLRIEDTDAERSKTEFEAELIKGLHWLGLDWDEGPDYVDGKLISKGSFSPYRQSERQEIYKTYVKQLLADGKAYYCYCTKEELEAQQQALLASGLPPKYNGHCRNLTEPPAGHESKIVRFKTPETKISFKDVIRGNVEFDAAFFDDMIVARSDGSVLYNLAVVIDDHLMKITHVIRGEDHISNTPKQILFQRALGFDEPFYAHLPLILNQDRSKFSKRKNKASMLEYETEGYLPEAMVNFLTLLGWHPRDDREVLSLDELIKEFDLERVQKAGAIFDKAKLDWLNREYMKKYSDADLAAMAKPFILAKYPELATLPDRDLFVERLIAIERTRATTLADIARNVGFFFAVPAYEAKLLVWKETPMNETRTVLEDLRHVLENISDADFRRETLSPTVLALTAGEGRSRGVVLWPLRVALSGSKSSPDPIDIMSVLGKNESLRRVSVAIQKLH